MTNPAQSSPAATVDVSVIIVTYNSASCIASCLAAVAAQLDVTFEIIVVDNDSSDGTVAASKGFDVRLIANQKNVGFGTANNQGFEISRGRFVYVLNPDAELAGRDALAKICRALDANKNWGMAGTRVTSTDGHDEPEPPTTYPGQFHAKNQFDKLPGKIAWVIGASMVFRREVYAALGGFDPGFFLYSEETDLCLRLRQQGHEIGYIADVTVRHIGGASEKGSDPYDTCKRKMNGIQRFWRKHYSPDDAARLVRRDLYQARFRMFWHGLKARFQSPGSRSWRKAREYRAIWETSRDFLKTNGQ